MGLGRMDCIGRLPYISEKGFESEEERMMREVIERAKSREEEKQKLREQFIEVRFNEWLEQTPKEKIEEVVPPVGEFMGLVHKGQLREHFESNVFQQ